MVVHDMLGISCLDETPKFVKNFMKEAQSIDEAFELYVSQVKNGEFPAKEHTFF